MKGRLWEEGEKIYHEESCRDRCLSSIFMFCFTLANWNNMIQAHQFVEGDKNTQGIANRGYV